MSSLLFIGCAALVAWIAYWTGRQVSMSAAQGMLRNVDHDHTEPTPRERAYHELMAQRREWRQRHDERRGRFRAGVRSVVRESLPNMVGTVAGGGILYLVAVVSGLLDDVPTTSIVLTGIMLVGLVLAIYLPLTMPPGPPPEIIDIMERDALADENERLRHRLGLDEEDGDGRG